MILLKFRLEIIAIINENKISNLIVQKMNALLLRRVPVMAQKTFK